MYPLKDSQIWESDRCIVQIQSLGENIFDFRGIIFEKKKDGTLKFNNVIYNEKNRLVDFMISLNMKPAKKKIVTKDKNNAQE